MELGIGKMADGIAKLRDRLAAMKAKHAEKEAPLVAEEERLRADLLEALGKAGLTSAKGARGHAIVEHSTLYVVSDWAEVHAWVRKNNRLDLLQQRIKQSAVAEIADAGKSVPGIGTERTVKLVVRKVK